MSVQNPHSPVCIIAGEITPLAVALAAKLEKISCKIYFLPTKITATKHNISQERIIKESQLTNENINAARYIFYFAPESILASEAGYQEHFSLTSSLLEFAKKFQAKTTYVTRDIKEYAVVQDSQGEDSYKQSNSQISKHIQQLTLLQQSSGGEGGYQTVVVVRDLVGGEINRENPLVVCGLYKNIPNNIFIIGSESHTIHPMDCLSVANQLVKLTFSQNFSRVPYEILGSQQLTLINAALFLKSKLETKIKTPIQIESIVSSNNYPKQKTQKVYINPTKEALSLLEDSAEWSIKNPSKTKTLKSSLPRPPIYKKISKPNVVEKKKKTKKKFKFQGSSKIVYLLLMGVSLSLVVPPVLFYYHAKKASETFMVGDYSQSIYNLNKANRSLSVSKPFITLASYTAKYIFPDKNKDFYAWMSVMNQLGLVTNKSEKLLSDSREVVSQIIINQKGDVFSQIENIVVDLEGVFNQLSLAQANLSSLDENLYNPQHLESIEKLKTTLHEGRKNVDSLISILKIAPQFLGRGESKTYLTLLQNNAELRPTGGFVGSFALITFDNGKLLDVETFDVYSADGQLKGHVEPPEPIKKYLGEANWYLRDSNWDPDFSVSARRAEWFLNKELGRQVDGTIGINLYTIKDLLAVVGGVELADYQETITADNLFQRAEYFSELNYFDGSTQKKDFISSLINSIYFKISSPTEDFGIKAIYSFIKNANQSQLQISLRDKSAESMLENTIFSGSLNDSKCSLTEKTCISDYVSVIESNMGINKVNYFVGRSIEHRVVIGNDSTSAQTSVFLENKAETAAWPAGTYKNYIRFLIPENASVNKVLVDGKTVRAVDLEIISNNGKKSVGFLVEVPISSQKTATVEYSLKHPKNPTNSYQYSLFYEKQSGTSGDPVSIQISSSQSNTPIKTSMGDIEGNFVNISTNNDTDREVIVDYIR